MSVAIVCILEQLKLESHSPSFVPYSIKMGDEVAISLLVMLCPEEPLRCLSFAVTTVEVRQLALGSKG